MPPTNASVALESTYADVDFSASTLFDIGKGNEGAMSHFDNPEGEEQKDSQSEEIGELKRIIQHKCDELMNLRKAKADRYLIKSLDDEILQLKVTYYEQEKQRFPVPADDIAYEFVYNYYDMIDYERSISSLMQYYQQESAYTINGYNKFYGQASIMKSIMANFVHLSITHNIFSVDLDLYPPKRCVLFIKTYGNIILDGDRPRKFMEIFELNYAQKDGFGASKYFISNQIFTIIDSRPLYAWPAYEEDLCDDSMSGGKQAPDVIMAAVAEQERALSSNVGTAITGAISGVATWMRGLIGDGASEMIGKLQKSPSFQKAAGMLRQIGGSFKASFKRTLSATNLAGSGGGSNGGVSPKKSVLSSRKKGSSSAKEKASTPLKSSSTSSNTISKIMNMFKKSEDQSSFYDRSEHQGEQSYFVESGRIVEGIDEDNMVRAPNSKARNSKFRASLISDANGNDNGDGAMIPAPKLGMRMSSNGRMLSSSSLDKDGILNTVDEHKHENESSEVSASKFGRRRLSNFLIGTLTGSGSAKENNSPYEGQGARELPMKQFGRKMSNVLLGGGGGGIDRQQSGESNDGRITPSAALVNQFRRKMSNVLLNNSSVSPKYPDDNGNGDGGGGVSPLKLMRRKMSNVLLGIGSAKEQSPGDEGGQGQGGRETPLKQFRRKMSNALLGGGGGGGSKIQPTHENENESISPLKKFGKRLGMDMTGSKGAKVHPNNETRTVHAPHMITTYGNERVSLYSDDSDSSSESQASQSNGQLTRKKSNRRSGDMRSSISSNSSQDQGIHKAIKQVSILNRRSEQSRSSVSSNASSSASQDQGIMKAIKRISFSSARSDDNRAAAGGGVGKQVSGTVIGNRIPRMSIKSQHTSDAEVESDASSRRIEAHIQVTTQKNRRLSDAFKENIEKDILKD